uniref:G-protein coupled receptors family 1 profile domain-containing protein n=1 Tax=Ditylenchus dipsaci TaxID=166011 RepID=A0A915EAJ1_9BILA
MNLITSSGSIAVSPIPEAIFNQSQLPSTSTPQSSDVAISEEEFFASLPVFDMFPLSNGMITKNRVMQNLPYSGACGRCLSTFVLAAMAFDRFLRVCYPHKKTSLKVVVIQLVSLSMLTFLLLSPLLIKASSEEIVLKEVLLENPYRLARVRIFKCMDHLEGIPLAVFILYMFIIGFFVPVVLIALFYALMVRQLVLRSRTMPSSQLPVNRIASFTIAISGFFVLCWLPYWVAMLYVNLYVSDEDTGFGSTFSSDTFIYVMYGIHALPYFNSASNWLFYANLCDEPITKRLHGKQSKEESRVMATPITPTTPLRANSDLASFFPTTTHNSIKYSNGKNTRVSANGRTSSVTEDINEVENRERCN